MSSDLEKNCPPPPYQVPVERSDCFQRFLRICAIVIGILCVLVAVMHKRWNLNPALPIIICIPMLTWGLVGRPNNADIRWMGRGCPSYNSITMQN